MIIEKKKIQALSDKLADEQVKGRSPWVDARKRFMRNKAATTSMVVLFLVVLYAFFGPYFAQYPNDGIDFSLLGQVAERGGPSLENGHYFGVDELGRDLFARTAQGTQISLLVGLIGAVIAVIVGTLYGATSAYIGGMTDSVMMRFVDIMIAIPYMFLIILVLTVFGRSVSMLFLGIGLFSWMEMARIARGQTLSLKNAEFITAAHSIGVPTHKIILRHIIPNLLGIIIVFVSLLVPTMILLESFISFLGLGIQEPLTSLGALINEGSGTMQYGTLWQLAFPLFFFVITLFSLFFIGDGLRDALDPKDR